MVLSHKKNVLEIYQFLFNKQKLSQTKQHYAQNYDKIMSMEKDLVEMFNKHYINIVGHSSEIKPY